MLVAYHGKVEIRDLHVARIQEHRAAERLVQHYGYYNYASRKGCAVGCTLQRDLNGVDERGPSNHKEYETQLGIPQILARLEDGIFEGLPKDRAMSWPEEFLMAIQPGADLSGVWKQFAPWLLIDEQHGVIKFAKTDAQREAINRVAQLYLREEAVSPQEWRDASAAADKERRAAYAAAYDAAAYDAAAYAAYAADAAYAAAADAAYAAADAAAAAAARSQSRIAQADKLLELLKAAPMAVTAVA